MILRMTGTLLLMALLVAALASPLLADAFLEQLQPDQRIEGFRAMNVYENGAGKALGARFLSEKYGFLIDVMQIQSVPQAYFWIKTPIVSSMGEPHACEHLLLGKGNLGRYVAALEQMALSSSTASTGQNVTNYNFNTIAGEDTFYDIFEAKLQALLHPDFKDEEIRREVCHIGINEDQQTGKLSLEEKGTVYTEMVSSYERPYYHTWKALSGLVYGENHPLTLSAGGDPDVMRSMVPADMWAFHKKNYHLSNMGVIVAIPGDIPMERFLARMGQILDKCQSWQDSSQFVGISAIAIPPATPAPAGTVKLVTYPSDRAEDPGSFYYQWPADLKMGLQDEFMMDVFFSVFANSQTANLYKTFINSETRKIDCGATSVSGGYDDDINYSIYFNLDGVNANRTTPPMIDTVLNLIRDELRAVAGYADGSAELREFNDRARNELLLNRKQLENQLNQPPLFGFRRGSSGAWVNLLDQLEKESGFRKSMVSKDRYALADSLLSLDKNIWREYIDTWAILTTPPYAVGATPSPEWLEKKTTEKEARLAGYVQEFETKYGVADPQAAIAKYKEEFDAKTAELNAIATGTTLPGFIEHPPMTIDDQLVYETITLPGNIPLVASTFDNMTSSEVGLCLRLDCLPESLMVCLPFLPSVLTDIGVIENGKPVSFEEMDQRLRREVLNLNSYFIQGSTTGRVELVLSGQGSSTQELKNALSWMDACLYSPYLSVDNLPRMLDLVDQSLAQLRNTTKGSEEDWVSSPTTGYRFQRNPLYMSTACFLTRTHAFQRLKWLLTDPGNETDQAALRQFITALHQTGAGKTREELSNLLGAVETGENAASLNVPQLSGLSDAAAVIARDVARGLKASLSDIPDATLAADWDYLCNETLADLLRPPQQTLSAFNDMLTLLRKTDNARMYMVSSGSDRAEALDLIKGLVARLDSKKASVRQQYAAVDRVVERLRDRFPGIAKPTYVGLVHEGTRNGVMTFGAKIAGVYDTSATAVLNCLSGKLYGGQGPHGLFMKTWGAGLAYSNGYTYSPANGRVSYYAERCPDIAETMRFVVDQLRNAQDDSTLTTYAIAQSFLDTRASSRYETRGRAMADDLTDGFTPEKVRAFRQELLDIRRQPGLYDRLKAQMQVAYGPVLIGYGEPLSKSVDGTFFIIGPETQFQSLEKYIAGAETPQPVYRLYPRDFWLTK